MTLFKHSKAVYIVFSCALAIFFYFIYVVGFTATPVTQPFNMVIFVIAGVICLMTIYKGISLDIDKDRITEEAKKEFYRLENDNEDLRRKLEAKESEIKRLEFITEPFVEKRKENQKKEGM